MGGSACKYCKTELQGGECQSCLACYRWNYEVFFLLVFFFSMPSIFIVRGTGNLWYLTLGLIGVFIYVFVASKVRDDEATFRKYQSVKRRLDALRGYQAGEIGILELASKDPVLRNTVLRSRGRTEEVETILSNYEAMVSPPTVEEQNEKISEDLIGYIEEIVSNNIKDYASCLEEAKKQHRKVIEHYSD